MSITDTTPLAHEIHAMVTAGQLAEAAAHLPPERPYHIDDDLLSHLR